MATELMSVAAALKSMKRADSGLTWIKRPHVTAFLTALAQKEHIRRQLGGFYARLHGTTRPARLGEGVSTLLLGISQFRTAVAAGHLTVDLDLVTACEQTVRQDHALETPTLAFCLSDGEIYFQHDHTYQLAFVCDLEWAGFDHYLADLTRQAIPGRALVDMNHPVALDTESLRSDPFFISYEQHGGTVDYQAVSRLALYTQLSTWGFVAAEPARPDKSNGSATDDSPSSIASSSKWPQRPDDSSDSTRNGLTQQITYFDNLLMPNSEDRAPRPDDPASDQEKIPARSNRQDWVVTWHPPGEVPDGTPHGAAGVCVTSDNRVILISNDQLIWDLPQGDQKPAKASRTPFAAKCTKKPVQRSSPHGSLGSREEHASTAGRKASSSYARSGAPMSTPSRGNPSSKSGTGVSCPRPKRRRA